MKTVWITKAEQQNMTSQSLRERIQRELGRVALEYGIVGTETVEVSLYQVPEGLELPTALPPWQWFDASWEIDEHGRPYVFVHASEG